MSWGDMMREKMRENVEFSMRMRRLRRTWYHLTEDTANNIAGFVCLLMALVVCGALWYGLDMILGVFR